MLAKVQLRFSRIPLEFRHSLIGLILERFQRFGSLNSPYNLAVGHGRR